MAQSSSRATAVTGGGCYRNSRDERLRQQFKPQRGLRPSRWVAFLGALTAAMGVAVGAVQPVASADVYAPTGFLASAPVDIGGRTIDPPASAPSLRVPALDGGEERVSNDKRPASISPSTTATAVEHRTSQPPEPEQLDDSTTPAEEERKPLPGVRRWQKISSAEFRRQVQAAGMDTAEFITPNIAYGTISEPGQQIHVVMIHRSAIEGMKVSPVERGREPVGAWAEAIGAAVGINANWYGPFDGPVVAAGEVYGGTDHGYTALFGFADDGRLVAQHHRAVNGSVDERIVEAVSGHPTLVHRREITTDFGEDPTFTARHPRTAIGATKSTDVIIAVVVDGRRRDANGMTGAETASLMARLGAANAVMLDGGGSSAMWIRERGVVNRPADPGRRVGNQIAFLDR